MQFNERALQNESFAAPSASPVPIERKGEYLPMRIAAVLCEYNPFHNGHAYQIAQIRSTLPDAVIIAIMSGNYVQRGEPAILCKYDRAKAAVLAGVDLVLELPFPHCCASAETFASAGISIAASLGIVDTLAFGAEAEDLPGLQRIAKRLDSYRYREALAGLCEKNKHSSTGFPAQREALYRSLFGDDGISLLNQPNNILAIEYLRALQNHHDITPLLIQRYGAPHDHMDTSLSSASASASQIRAWILDQNRACIQKTVPDESLAILDCAHHSGRSPADIKRAEAAILWYFRNTAPHTTSLYADMPDGMAERLHHAAIQADSLEDMLSRCKTKKYTNARLRRSLLYAFFRVSVVSLSTFPAFTCVLAANIRGTAVLNKIKKRAALPLLTKPAHYKKLSDKVRSAFELSLSADIFWHMLLHKPLPASAVFRYSPYIHKKEGNEVPSASSVQAGF